MNFNQHVNNSGLIKHLRTRALDKLHESSDLFDRAFSQLQEGSLEEAEKTKELARSKRNASILLMSEANNLEKNDASRNKKPISS
jgi:hypothetical protein